MSGMFTDDEWEVFNRCRAMLIRKKVRGGLTVEQEQALIGMQRASLEYVNARAPSPPIDLEYLKQLEERAIREEERRG